MALRWTCTEQNRHWSGHNARAFGAVLALAGTIGLAEAQFFNQPVPRYYPAPHYQPRPYPEIVYSHPAPIISVAPIAPVEFGSVCATPAGECGTYRAVPLGAGCSCRIPGYGQVAGSAR